LHRIAPSFVFFISGILAGAAVNLVTAIPTGSVSAQMMRVLLWSAAFWLGASIAMAVFASILEGNRDETTRVASQNLQQHEIQALRGALLKRKRTPLLISGLLAVALTIIAVRFALSPILQQPQSPSSVQAQPSATP
jgi:small-conductance mechanosensitive channel